MPKKIVTGFYLDEEIKHRFLQAAKRQRRSMSQLGSMIIESWLDQNEKENSPCKTNGQNLGLSENEIGKNG